MSNEMGIFEVMYNCRAMRRLDTREVEEEKLMKLHARYDRSDDLQHPIVVFRIGQRGVLNVLRSAIFNFHFSERSSDYVSEDCYVQNNARALS